VILFPVFYAFTVYSVSVVRVLHSALTPLFTLPHGSMQAHWMLSYFCPSVYLSDIRYKLQPSSQSKWLCSVLT